MSRSRLICTPLSAAELRGEARREEDRRAAMRMLAIAHAIEGMVRAEAARLADMSEQALRDAIKRYNAEGLVGVYDLPRPGRPSKLTAEQQEELRKIVLAGPDVETDGLSAFTRDDLAKIAKEKWGVGLAARSVGRILANLGLSRQKARPSHPKKDPEAAAAFSKNAGHSAQTC